MLLHENINKKEIGLKGGVSRRIQKVRIYEQEPILKDMKILANFLWQANRDCDEFTVFLYLLGMKTDESAYSIFEFNDKELKFYRILDKK